MKYWCADIPGATAGQLVPWIHTHEHTGTYREALTEIERQRQTDRQRDSDFLLIHNVDVECLVWKLKCSKSQSLVPYRKNSMYVRFCRENAIGYKHAYLRLCSPFPCNPIRYHGRTHKICFRVHNPSDTFGHSRTGHACKYSSSTKTDKRRFNVRGHTNN